MIEAEEFGVVLIKNNECTFRGEKMKNQRSFLNNWMGGTSLRKVTLQACSKGWDQQVRFLKGL